MAEQEITQEELDEIRKLREQKAQQKPIDFKKSIYMLVNALREAKTIDGYQTKQKDYPSDLILLTNNGATPFKNPTIVKYIAKAECIFAEQHAKEILKIVVEEIEKELNEIRGILG